VTLGVGRQFILAPLPVGQPVFDIERLVTAARRLDGFNYIPRHANFVLASLEMALWDILGKDFGLSVHQLLAAPCAARSTTPACPGRHHRQLAPTTSGFA
jgi:L-alanine-DL-glutamate epimerase-like enolase superfamily enzyme